MFLVAQVAEELVSRVGELRHVDFKYDELAHAFFYIGFKIEFCTRLSRAAHRGTQPRQRGHQGAGSARGIPAGLRFEEHPTKTQPHTNFCAVLTSGDRAASFDSHQPDRHVAMRRTHEN